MGISIILCTWPLQYSCYVSKPNCSKWKVAMYACSKVAIFIIKVTAYVYTMKNVYNDIMIAYLNRNKFPCTIKYTASLC